MSMQGHVLLVCYQINYLSPCEIVVCICKPTLNEEDVVNLYRMVQDHHKAFGPSYL